MIAHVPEPTNTYLTFTTDFFLHNFKWEISAVFTRTFSTVIKKYLVNAADISHVKNLTINLSVS